MLRLALLAALAFICAAAIPAPPAATAALPTRLVLPALAADPAVRTPADALAAARLRWDTAAITRYELVVRWDRALAHPIRVTTTAVDGEATGKVECLAPSGSSCGPPPAATLTVDDLFARIDSYIADAPDGPPEPGDAFVTVAYDPLLGYPISLYANRYRNPDTVESRVVESFTVLP